MEFLALNHSLEQTWLSGAVGRLIKPAGEPVGECSEHKPPGGSARTVAKFIIFQQRLNEKNYFNLSHSLLRE